MSVRWIGRLLANHTGWHTITHASKSNAVARVIVSGVLLYGWSSSWTGHVFLVTGQAYNIVVELRKVSRYDTSMDLTWTGPDLTADTIPSHNLLHYTAGFACSCPAGACSGSHGECVNGACLCDHLYEGSDCAHYRCKSPECYGQDSDSCHDPTFGSAQHECNGQGNCIAGECVCDFGLTAESSACGVVVRAMDSALDTALAMSRWACACATVATWARTAISIHVRSIVL